MRSEIVKISLRIFCVLIIVVQNMKKMFKIFYFYVDFLRYLCYYNKN